MDTSTNNHLMDLNTLNGWETLFLICRKAIQDDNFTCPQGNLLIPLGAGYELLVDSCYVDFRQNGTIIARVKYHMGEHKVPKEELRSVIAAANLKVMMGVMERVSF